MCSVHCSLTALCKTAMVKKKEGTCTLFSSSRLDEGVSLLGGLSFITLLPVNEDGVLLRSGVNVSLEEGNFEDSAGTHSLPDCIALCRASGIKCYGGVLTRVSETGHACRLVFVDMMQHDVQWEETAATANVSLALLEETFPEVISAADDSTFELMFVAVAGSETNITRKWMGWAYDDDLPARIERANIACFKVDNIAPLSCLQSVSRDKIRSSTEDLIQFVLYGPGDNKVNLTFENMNNEPVTTGIGQWFVFNAIVPSQNRWMAINGDTIFTPYSIYEVFSITENISTDNCATAAGWLLVVDSPEHPCLEAWGLDERDVPIILYSNEATAVRWGNGHALRADKLAIFVSIPD